MRTPDGLPETEAAVRERLAQVAALRADPRATVTMQARLQRLMREYDDAVIVLRLDAVAAFRAAWRATYRRGLEA